MPNIYEGDAGLGAATTPEEWATYVLDHLSYESVLLASGARRVDTSAKQIHVPRLTSDGAAGWYDELDEIGPGDPTGDDLVLTPKKCAALTVISNETVLDSNPSVLASVGDAMTRAVALEADRALFAGGGALAPDGFLNDTSLTASGTTVDYASIVTGAGVVRAAGGAPDVLYLAAADYTALQLATGADDRPLIQPDASQGAAASVAGLRIHPTPALTAGVAVVAQADQIIVAVRSDASVTFSGEAKFTQDATIARVIARVDGGIADANGVVVVGTGV